MTESISQTFPGAESSGSEEGDFQAVSTAVSVNSTFKRSISTKKQQFRTTVLSELLHYLLTHFNSKTTTEKGGSLPFKTLPVSVKPLNVVGFIFSGCSKVL